MSQVMPRLTYPGGRSAFFADLHLDFPRWLRLVSLVPLVHASIEGVSYDELCFHLLHVFPFNPSNVLVVSAERIRSSVAEMLSSEPFFAVRWTLSLAKSALPHIFSTHYSAHLRIVDQLRRLHAGFMSLLSTPTLLEFHSPFAFCGP